MNEPRTTTSSLLRPAVVPARPGAARRFLHGLAVSLSIVSAAPSCDCDDTCGDTVTIRFDTSSEWEKGTYVVDLKIDGEAVSCTFEIPSRGFPTDHCDEGSKTSITDEGVFHRGSPDEVSLTISFEGTALASATLQPHYRGPKDWDRAACGAPCDIASEMISVP